MKRRTPIQIPRDPGYEVGSASPGIWPVAADGTVTRHFSAYSRHITTLRAAVEITFFLLVIGFIVLFGFAGTDKVTHLAKFQDGLKNSPFIPVWAAWLFAYAVIASFFAIAISLLIGFWKPKIITIGLWLATGLLLIFTLYIAAIVTGITYKPCTCIGLDENLGLDWGAHLLLNAALLALAWATTLLHDAYKILFAISEAPSQPLKNGKL